MSEIEPGLFVGGFAEADSVEWLQQSKITHVITVDSFRREFADGITSLYINAADVPDTDLLSHFDRTFEFISEALAKEGGVLIHCMAGISRSVTILTAFLMRKYKEGFETALERVLEKRSYVCPNDGFKRQLRLYESLGFMLNKSHPSYEEYFKKQLAPKLGSRGFPTSQEHFDVCLSIAERIADHRSAQLRIPEADASDAIYKCRKCRNILFSEGAVVRHNTGCSVNIYLDDCNKAKSEASQNANDCEHGVYVLPLSWMQEMIKERNGKLNCVKCDAKLGSFAWHGMACACRAWVTPGFHIQFAKVDRMKKLIVQPTTANVGSGVAAQDGNVVDPGKSGAEELTSLTSS